MNGDVRQASDRFYAGLSRLSNDEQWRAATARIIGSLSDAQPATAAPAFGQPVMAARDIAEHILIGHIQMYLASIRQAIGATPTLSTRPLLHDRLLERNTESRRTGDTSSNFFCLRDGEAV